jgi:hypothetical protein
LISKYDELVTPTTTSSVHEDDMRNLYVQDLCPNDPLEHIREAYDLNDIKLLRNALKDDQAGPKVCVAGSSRSKTLGVTWSNQVGSVTGLLSP